MRCRDAKNELASQRDALRTRPAEGTASEIQKDQKQPDLLGNSPSHVYPGISTERIMLAVEQQRRITQQLEHLQARQKQRQKLLKITLPVFVVSVFLALGILSSIFVVLFFFKPDALVRILSLLSDSIAAVIAMVLGIKAAWSELPSNSWLLSAGSLAVVLMMGLWLRLMRSPSEG